MTTKKTTAMTTGGAGTSLVSRMGAKYGVEGAKLYECLKATAFKGAASNEQLMALMIVADQYGLNPLTKEKYADQAAEVAPVTVHVEAPKAKGMNLRKRVKATVVDLPAFLQWCAAHPDGDFVEVKTAALERARSSYAGFKPHGVKFEEVLG